jgi:hypothetical protein
VSALRTAAVRRHANFQSARHRLRQDRDAAMQTAPRDDLRDAESADDGPQRSFVSGRTHSSSDAAVEFAGTSVVYRARAAERTPRILGEN